PPARHPPDLPRCVEASVIRRPPPPSRHTFARASARKPTKTHRSISSDPSRQATSRSLFCNVMKPRHGTCEHSPRIEGLSFHCFLHPCPTGCAHRGPPGVERRGRGRLDELTPWASGGGGTSCRAAPRRPTTPSPPCPS